MFDVNKMDDEFYLNFDESFWLKKATLTKQLLDDKNLRLKCNIETENNSDFLLKDLYMTRIHCCETLLRIILVTKKHKHHPVIPLISISPEKYNLEIKKITKFGIDKYMNSEDILKELFYPYKFSNSKDIEGLELSLNFIKTAIELISRDYLNHNYYNVLKHGFYGTTLSDFSFSVNDPKTKKNIELGKSDKMLTWIELGSKKTKIIEHNSAYSVQRDINIIKIASVILQQLFSTRKALIKNEKPVVSFFTKGAYENLKKIFYITTYGSTMLNFKHVQTVTIHKELFDL